MPSATAAAAATASAGAAANTTLTMMTTTTSSSFMFDFERRFDHVTFRSWMSDNWTVALWCSAIYLVAIAVIGRWYMPRRQRAFDLRRPLTIWNVGLAVFSLAGAARMVPELIDIVTRRGFTTSLCDSSYCVERPTSFWAAAFAVSKVVELGDTVFIVLRRQPLILLHWYHHVTVLINAWYSYDDMPAYARWFLAMNYVVHSAMYAYYAARAARIRIPRPVGRLITTTQIVQMVVGLAITWSAYRKWSLGGDNDEDCSLSSSSDNLGYDAAMYASYLVLFCRFFYVTYLRSPEADRKDARENGKKSD